MKGKVFFAALLSAMLVAVSGCGGSANSPASSNDETTAEQTTEETTETTEAEETETEDDGDAAFDPDWWREYTDSVGKLTTDLDFMGLGLAMPLDWNDLIPHITETSFRQLVADGTISGGMIPKLENAFAAIHAGVTSVRITHISNLQGGTVISSEK